MCTKVMINFERVTIYKGFFFVFIIIYFKDKRKVFLKYLFLFLEVNDLLIKRINVLLYLRWCDVESKLECGEV